MSFKKRITLLAILPLFIFCSSCRKSGERYLSRNGGIITPLTGSSSVDDKSDAESKYTDENGIIPLVDPGSNFKTVALMDVNLDEGQSDEQVLVTLPLNKPEANLQLMVASTVSNRNTYDIVWSTSLSTRTLTGVLLRSDDLNGDRRNDIIVSGFNEKGEFVTEIFAVPGQGGIEDFRKIFGLNLDGNIDIVTEDRSPGYYSGTNAGEPFVITVQKEDPASETGLDLVETDWRWDRAAFAYRQGESRKITGQTILEDKMALVYAGDAAVYEGFLKGAWYRETGDGVFIEMVSFDPEQREVIFYNGTIQEIFTWEESHRTTAKRLYSRVSNAIIPSLTDTVMINAESWEQIELMHAAATWNGIYRRLGPAIQNVLDKQSSLPPIVAPATFSGVWRSPGDAEIIFNLPGVEWIENGKRRTGTASIFTLGDTIVLQIQFMKPNGSLEEIVSWETVYREDRDATRIIRSISLTPAVLKVDGVRTTGTTWRRYEQIEIIAGSE